MEMMEKRRTTREGEIVKSEEKRQELQSSDDDDDDDDDEDDAGKHPENFPNMSTPLRHLSILLLNMKILPGSSLVGRKPDFLSSEFNKVGNFWKKEKLREILMLNSLFNKSIASVNLDMRHDNA